MEKGRPFQWPVKAFNSSGDSVTGIGGSITATLLSDNSTSGSATTDTNPSEIGSDGVYLFGITSSESNVTESLILLPTSTAATQVIPAPMMISIDPENYSELGIGTDGDVSEVNTLTGHTAQTGDSFARIGSAGTGLTGINLPDQTINITGNLSGSVGSVTAAVTTDAVSRSASQADVSDIPNNSEFNARTLPSTSYAQTTEISALNDFDPAVDVVANVTLVDTVTANTDLVSAADIKTAMEADGGDLSSLMEALVNKRVWTEASGDLEMFNDAGVSQGTITGQVTSDGTFTTAKRALI